MVDLDQTLIHTTEQHCQRMSNKVLFHHHLFPSLMRPSLLPDLKHDFMHKD